MLRPYIESSDAMFPARDKPEGYDFGAPDEAEVMVDHIKAHRWTTTGKVEFEVSWNDGDVTWEPFQAVKLLIALDDYFALHGVNSWRKLSKAGKKQGGATEKKH
ncbi:Transcription factor [Mycena indigotica]|uniref:Transcription factor n=1 Tax=Mycena indigotica TaxID=2126181 RepID=A0A8H6W0I3_9AGAR|nr:Transcription factor [Mycena indigotica]KAF7298561.1 Transcription factor [Mycena indigotica]